MRDVYYLNADFLLREIDAVDMARGVAIAGAPRFWLVVGQRLYLFAREDSRDTFAAAPARFLTGARKQWPVVQETLAR